MLAVAQVAILVWYFMNSRKKSKAAREKKDLLAREYPYEGMRNVALNANPGAIIANVPDNEVYVYGAAMDWDMGNDTITLIAQITGDASMYVKSGGGIVGGGKHPNVSEAAQKFINKAQQFLQFTSSTNATPLPDKNCIRFYLLTNKGKFTAGDSMANIENKSSHWAGLFEEANTVIMEMKKSVITI